MEKKQLFTILIIFFLLLITKNGYCENKNVYTAADSRYTIQYPSSWRYEEAKGPSLGPPIFSPLRAGFPVLGVVVIPEAPPMEVLKIDYKFKNVEEALKALIDSYSRLENTDFAAGFVLLDKGTDTIDNNEAGFIIYELSKRNVKRKEYVFFDNEEVNSVQYEAYSEYFDEYLPEADAIMKSIKISKKVLKENKEEENVSSGYWDQVYMPEDQLCNIAKAAKGYYEVYSSYPDNLSVLANAEPPWIDKRLLDGWKGYKFEIIKSDKKHFIAVAMPIQKEPMGTNMFCVTEDGIVKETHQGDILSYEYVKTLKAVNK